MNHPTLSIVMPVYNAAKYVGSTLSSILAQTFPDFELIVIDDGSNDESVQIIQSFSDTRIRFFKNDKNEGIVYSRNRGLALMRGRYYAPFDADDIALPDKFEKQIRFLNDHQEYGMIGSWALLIKEDGSMLNERWKLKAKPETIPWIMLFKNYFVHSAIVVRREAIPDGLYTTGYDLVEDYKMCFDISRRWKVWNTPEYLVKYRIYESSHSRRDLDRMTDAERKVFNYVYHAIGLRFDEEIFEYIQQIRRGKEGISLTEYRKVERWLYELWQELIKQNGHSRPLKRVIYYEWLKWVWSSRASIFKSPWQGLRSPFLRELLSNEL